MHILRSAESRGYADHGWLRSYHSFSFANYYDPAHMGFGPLRVINEDRVAPGHGFGKHAHSDMEIISYVLDGELAHEDTLGNGSILGQGKVQRMSAGSGVQHSEFNHSKHNEVHFLQIWITPDARGLAPSYEEAHFSDEEKRGKLRLIASPEGRDGAVLIHQDARLFATLLDGTERIEHSLAAGRQAYVHIVKGSAVINGEYLSGGDALKVNQEAAIVLENGEDAEILLFDLPE
ncbi:pirin family protein [Phytohalomonas tamaricis]|uniref:pirin family protein n=1 Tax=Phytohalomonas tamaricis TaxID=2081032 RepID=UPI000D0B7696|nr:pirin family protein [Phytohalomonas tamaricis]